MGRFFSIGLDDNESRKVRRFSKGFNVDNFWEKKQNGKEGVKILKRYA